MRRQAGRNKQYNYFFDMKLINANTGLEAWVGQTVDVQKSGTKSAVGG